MNVRKLRIRNMQAMMHRLQDEDPAEQNPDPDKDEIYGLLVVIEKDRNGRVLSAIVEGSDVYITVGADDREKWLELSPQGDWFRGQFDAQSVLHVTWVLMEEDSVLDTDLGQAITELTEGLIEEVQGQLPGIERAKALYLLVTRFIDTATSDDRLGSMQHIFDLANDPPVTPVRVAFPCRGGNAYYHAWAHADLGPIQVV